MIYFDNAATTLRKPPEVAQAVSWAVDHLGNPGRSFAEPGMMAMRAVLAAREALAQLLSVDDPMRVAFTSGCTESLFLIAGTLGRDDHAIATQSEHNSVLRPLYHSGCALSILPCDERGVLCVSQLESLLQRNTRYVFVSHASNVTGNVSDVSRIYEICRAHGVTLVLDVAQTLGSLHVSASMADILCFTGHKALFGPMGTGGLCASDALMLPILKTGGTGYDSFSRAQCARMPDLAEAGSANVPGIHGLCAGINFLKGKGISAVAQREQAMTQRLYEGLSEIDGVHICGDFAQWPRAPIVSFALHGWDSAEVALALWERHAIATRAGSHCAPLLHERLGTKQSGLVRCSLSLFTTPGEVEQLLGAVRELASCR